MSADHDAAATVCAWLTGSGQHDATQAIAEALHTDGSRGVIDTRGDVPDGPTWAAAVLALVRSVGSVAAARLGALDVRPPWAQADNVRLGDIAAATARIAGDN